MMKKGRIVGEKTPRVLIVDDDPFVRDMLTFILETAEYEVVVADNGFEAFEKCTSDPGIELLVSDLNMPVMSGLELTRELRKHNVAIPIIVLTGDSEVVAAGEAVRSGANGYLVKDENIADAVLDALERTLPRHQPKP
jgi:CheY-like chemotaxis protein